MKTCAPLFAIALLTLVACGPDEQARDESSEIRTIRQEHVPRTINGEASEPGDASADDATRALPFEPPISMDPVDGSKVSLRADTPMVEHEGRLYHFSSEANRAKFQESPKKYLSGTLAVY
jgi:YHS domain-containing protein